MIRSEAGYYFCSIKGIEPNAFPFIARFIKKVGPSCICNECIIPRMEVWVQLIFGYFISSAIFCLVYNFTDVVWIIISSYAYDSEIPRSSAIFDDVIINIPIDVSVLKKKKNINSIWIIFIYYSKNYCPFKVLRLLFKNYLQSASRAGIFPMIFTNSQFSMVGILLCLPNTTSLVILTTSTINSKFSVE